MKKTKLVKTPQKYPLLKCPECGYSYQVEAAGWAFRTDKNTKCIGLPTEEEINPTKPIPMSRMPSYHHPFQVVEE